MGGVVCRRRLLGNLNRTKSRLRETVPSLHGKRASRHLDRPKPRRAQGTVGDFSLMWIASEWRRTATIGAIDRALELDPMSLWAHFPSALTLTCARRNDEAIRRARRALDWEPEFGFMRSVLGSTHAEKHEFPQAIHELERAARSQRVPTTLAFLAHGYAVSAGRSTPRRLSESWSRWPIINMYVRSKSRKPSPAWDARMRRFIG
jgi:hypothetical protein